MILKSLFDLTKLGIVIFVLLAGLAGYALSFNFEHTFSSNHLLLFVVGLYFLSSGSLALNQIQELSTDRKMPRTGKRPLITGKIKPAAALILAIAMILSGSYFLFLVSTLSFGLGLATIFLYNGLYTYWWKPNWIFAAVPGAIPGALPVTIGFAANQSNIFTKDSIYLFLILFLWQMPHFWALAIKYREDYNLAGIPVLPAVLGVEKTLYHMGLYTFCYVGVALASPWFVESSWIYLAFVVPMSLKLLYEFFKLFSAQASQYWLRFFMWVNVSVLIYLFVPVIDKWNFLFLSNH